ncbi:putative PEP-CTERM system TPR-repeat lipoprotein [Tepidimonas sediminis]|uniref:Putative PEP-CTERM system TPR-repeat lipoprotein n=1 Tax=Tepidimonas sediminis TaxID=2588941 RepID=A0A554WK87_9BURK|nr:tetratricopeptide repeat protein [Tepidimonas sediminis]TSE23992.1 putative PEP-CTERM system TPR-repeat lipoprotein [Tepidimonas sediminis]
MSCRFAPAATLPSPRAQARRRARAAWLALLLAPWLAWAQPGQDGEALLAQAQRQLAAGQATLALQALQGWLQDHPADARARLLLGVAQARAGDAAAAQATYEQLTREYPELPEPYNNLAVLHAAAGRLGEARMALEAALRAHPDYATAHRNLGDVYAQLALGHWQRALALQPDQPGLPERAAALRQLLQSTGR